MLFGFFVNSYFEKSRVSSLFLIKKSKKIYYLVQDICYNTYNELLYITIQPGGINSLNWNEMGFSV